ncbi:Zinc finger protein 609,Zinc finger protein 608 [Mytilus coruscus]|uniref:Zinc finger protein 609,Zinc finger protein 608 n=1 Tax=Mytilus coruscus TaxID=42192 RepID=A0A6J8DPG2_MYTCO|nr:Zinc finger protein 609,Zinc finger protein 608 [Mytilus coruscus]
MSGAEHHATVDRGLKMKIKRKNVNASKSDGKHEIVKGGEKMSSNESNSNSANGTQMDKVKQNTSGDKSPKVKGMHKKEKIKERVNKGSDVSSNDSSTSISQNHVGTDACSIGVATDPDCLGPCEPGTNVLLEGIVWQETENGVLVVNVTWRDKTYVGTLLDATKHEWAPPRFNCDSPVSDMDARTPKGRAKRGRGSNSTPVIEKSLEGRTLRKGRKGSNTFTAPPSPAKSDISVASVGLKRKGRPVEMENAVNDNAKVKRSRSCSRGTPGDGSESPVPNFIECPEPNCKKKYRHMNGLRYHQSHAHSAVGLEGDEESRDMDNTEDSMLEDLDSNMGESGENSSNNLKIDMDSIEDMDNKKGDSNDSDKIDIVNVVKPTVKPTAEVTKMDMDESSKKDNSISTNSPSCTVTKPTIGAGHSFHAVISSSKVCSETTLSSVSTTVQQTPSTINPPVLNVTPVSSSPIQSARPITFAAITTNSQSNELSSGKTEKLIKPKVMGRPIAPSNMIALTTNVTVTHTNLAPVTTHTHVSSTTQFQPIQPKPTVLGDSAAVNQHLIGLKELKEKKMKHKKKLKDKDANGALQNVNIAAAKLMKPDNKKSETSSVIKVAPIMAKPLESIKKEVMPISKPMDFEKEKSGPLIDKSSYPPNVGVITGQVQPQPKVVDLSHTPRTEASVLKVTPTLQVITNESNKSNINDDVQSPAYSDISDANEAGSPAQSASPQITDEKIVKPKDSQGATPGVSLDNQPLNQYGMYGNYYNPSPYLLSPAAQGSPGSNIQKIQTNPSVKDRSTPSEHLKVVGSAENKSKIDESKTEKTGDKIGDKVDRPPQQLSQHELQQLQHQQWVKQQMYALQSLPPQQQYQYMAAYGPYLDPNYHMHMMANDPLYRQHFEKMIDEQQKRMHQEGVPIDLESPRSLSRSSATDISLASGSWPCVDAMKNKPHNLSSEYSGGYPHTDTKRTNESEKDQKAVRERQQNDNRQQSSKELDVKPNIDKIRFEQQNPEGMKGQKDGKMSEEQARRMQMYKEQKYIEHQKRVEQKKGSDNRFEPRPMDLVGNKSVSSNNSPFSAEKSKDFPQGLVPNVTIKQEPFSKLKDRSDSAPDLSMTSKSASEERTRTPSSEKVKSIEERSIDKSDKFKNYEGPFDKLKNSETPSDKNRSSSVDTPKSKIGQYSKPSSPHTSLSQSPSGSHYSPYLYHSQFVQSPPTSYGHIPFDPYRNMVYPTNYIHPSQINYPGVGADNEKQKMVPISKAGPIEMDLKKSDPTTQANTSASHKIHELQEKGKAGSRSASPVTTNMTKSDKPISLPLSVGDKMRETSSPPTQRHVHTHHHTHVLEAAYPVYHYPSIYPAPPSQTQVPPGNSIQHPQYPP